MRKGRHPGTWAWLGDMAGLTGEGGESRFLELEHDSCNSPGDYGYSGWVQFDDGEIFCVYHHRDTAPHSYIRGCWLREEDVHRAVESRRGAPAVGEGSSCCRRLSHKPVPQSSP